MENNSFVIKTADQLDNTPIEWLIPDWIPQKGVTLLFGDGGVGKRFLWVSLVSALSKGNRNVLQKIPSNTEIKILCLSGEDAECILKKRFIDANANMQNIFVIAQDSEQPDITFKNGTLDALVDQVKPKLLVIDPLQSFIGENVDMSRRNQMRSAMKPLLALSAKNNMPVLVVCHSNKREKAESGRDKLADSADLWDISRSVIMCGINDNNERYISLEKSSYTDHLSVQTVLFSIESGHLVSTGTVSMKMRDFVREKKANSDSSIKTVSKKSECEDLILETLSSNEWMDNQRLEEVLKHNGFGNKTIRTAKTNLKNQRFIESKKSRDGKSFYRAIDEDTPNDPLSCTNSEGH